jgi:hypothetical protein
MSKRGSVCIQGLIIFKLPEEFTALTFCFAVAQLLRQCAISQKVAGSIPDKVIGIFQT